MKKLAFAAMLAAVALVAFGCAITNYPLITDDYGPWGGATVDSFYDKAQIRPDPLYGQAAFLYPEGSEELYTQVVQDWKGDQRLTTYANIDPTATVIFLAHTYCDPVRQTDCAIVTAQNPDVGDVDVFDYVFDSTCPGAQSLSILASYASRLGECGSGLWADRQNAAAEFSILETSTFRGKDVYVVPFNNATTEFTIGGDRMPLYGSYTGYIDEKLRFMMIASPNMKYNLRWLADWVEQNGQYMDVDLVYGSLTANFQLHATTFDGALDRF